jgi:hypothetical protein
MGIVQSLIYLHMVVVCIWGFGHQIPKCKHLHMGIPVCIRGSITKNCPKFHMGTPCLQMVVYLHMVINISTLAKILKGLQAGGHNR